MLETLKCRVSKNTSYILYGRKMMSIQAVMYLRCSTNSQETLNQKLILEEVAKQRNWEITKIYSDEGITGDGSKKRPQFDLMIRDATQGKFEMILAYSVCRISRNLSQLVSFLNEMNSLNVGVFLNQQAVDSTTPAGRLLVEVCGSMASFELAIQKDRIKAGIARRKAQGLPHGRPTTYNKSLGVAIRELRKNGTPIKKIASALSIGIMTVYRGLEEVEECYS